MQKNDFNTLEDFESESGGSDFVESKKKAGKQN